MSDADWTQRAVCAVLGDADIRPALCAFLKHTGDTVIEELGVCRGRVRVDVAVVNEAFHGFEIKSDRDSLRRLRGQVDFYGRVLDRATLVVGERHLEEATQLVPAWWGVLRVGNGPRFRTIRKGCKNRKRDPRALVELLWLEDALALLQRNELDRGVRGKPRRIVWDRVCEHFSVDEIGAAVRARLKARAPP